VELNLRILLRKLAHQGGFVGRQIVQNDVNLLALGAQRDDLVEEGDELAVGVASGGFP
jgi:hypothetical protein